MQYQAPLVPLRGLWNNAPLEGDKFVSCEIDWGVTTSDTNCVQVQLTSNSPVAISQIVALNVDNSRCGSDVQFLFPDSGSVLVVPAYNQGLYPVFTNALQFYVTAPNAGNGIGSSDVTFFQVLNSIPPPVAVQPSQEQTSSAAQGITLASNSITALVNPPTDGTLTGFQILASGAAGGTPSSAEITLSDGLGHVIWAGWIAFNENQFTAVPITITGLRQRFYDGLFFTIGGSTVTQGTATINIYYTVP